MDEVPGPGCARQDNPQGDGAHFFSDFTYLSHKSCFSGAVFPAAKYSQHIPYLKVFPFVIRNCSRNQDLAGSTSCSKLKGEGDPK